MSSLLTIVDSRSFPVSIFCGDGEKQHDSNCYLEPFMMELKSLEENGIDIDGKHLMIKFIAFICDAPARSFVKQIVGHCGKHACERCAVVGETISNRTVFNSMNAKIRTNESFRVRREIVYIIIM